MDNQKLSVKPKNGYGLVYCYTSPSGKRYIGQTRTTLKERVRKDAKGYKHCPAFFNAIKKYGWDNFSVEILAEVPYENLNETEAQYILYFNTTDPNYGYNIITEYSNFLSDMNRIPVYSYDIITGAFMEEYPSIAEAERAIGAHHGSIRRVLNLKNRRLHNRMWRTEKFDSIEPLENTKQKNSISVFLYDSNSGDFLAEFPSIREAARATGYNRCTIQEHVNRGHVVKGKKHTFRSFKVENLYNESSTTTVGSSESKQK